MVLLRQSQGKEIKSPDEVLSAPPIVSSFGLGRTLSSRSGESSIRMVLKVEIFGCGGSADAVIHRQVGPQRTAPSNGRHRQLLTDRAAAF